MCLKINWSVKRRDKGLVWELLSSGYGLLTTFFILLFPGPVQACLSHGASFSYSGSFACCHQCDNRRITRLSSHLRIGRIYQISSLATKKMWSDPKNQPVSSLADGEPARSHTRLSQGQWANGFTAGCSRITHQGLKFCILNHDDLDGYDLA